MISVVVPIYNAERCLSRCVESLLCQTYRDFEVILIDDGSHDGSASICERYCLADSRVRYHRQANQGVSAARNKGIELAHGDYVAFVDADDYVDQNFLKTFAEVVQKERTDLCIQGYKCTEFGDCVMPHSHETEWDEICQKAMILNDNHLLGYVWNKLFRKDIILTNHIQFNRKASLREDLLFVLQYLPHCKDLVVLPNIGYHYCDTGFHSYSFSAFNKSLDLTIDYFSKIDCLPDDVRKYWMTHEYWLSLYVIHVLYKEKHRRADRVNYLKKIKVRFRRYKNEKRFPSKVYVVLSFMIQNFPMFLNDLIFAYRYAK